MRKKAKTMPSVYQVDFYALPCSVQRKYFSSLERLQIQQQSRGEVRPANSPSGRSSRASSLPLRPPLTLVSRRRRRKVEAAALQGHHVSQTEVDFYLSLPAKVQKQHFSREEQVLFLESREQAFLPRHYYTDSCPDIERAQQRFDDFDFDFYDESSTASEADLRRIRSCSQRSTSSDQPASEAPSPLLDRHQHCTTVFTRLYDFANKADNESSIFHLDMTSPVSQSVPSTPTCWQPQTMSLTNTPIRHSTSSAMFTTTSSTSSSSSSSTSTSLSTTTIKEGPCLAQRPIARHQRAHSSLSYRESSHMFATPIFDPEATHYQDPEARRKLRTYLASPQKFDEAIEFGFPSTAGSDTTIPHYQLPPISAHHSRKFSRDMRTFLRDGKLTFFEDSTRRCTRTQTPNQGLDSDSDSVLDLSTPSTPSSSPGLSSRVHSRSQSHPHPYSRQISRSSSSLSSPGLPPRFNREMTLRMTLTRPDLRADDDQLYGWQHSMSPKHMRDDPLALEELVLTDDMTGTKGAFYVKPKQRGNLVARLLKKASLKGGR